MLALERIGRNRAREMLGRKARDALEFERPIAPQRVTDSQSPAIHDADHIARPRLFDRYSIARHELLRRGEANRFSTALMQHLHVGFEMPGHDAHERHAVAVLRIHVRLNLEHETREVFSIGWHWTSGRLARTG